MSRGAVLAIGFGLIYTGLALLLWAGRRRRAPIVPTPPLTRYDEHLLRTEPTKLIVFSADRSWTPAPLPLDVDTPTQVGTPAARMQAPRSLGAPISL